MCYSVTLYGRHRKQSHLMFLVDIHHMTWNVQEAVDVTARPRQAKAGSDVPVANAGITSADHIMGSQESE